MSTDEYQRAIADAVALCERKRLALAEHHDATFRLMAGVAHQLRNEIAALSPSPQPATAGGVEPTKNEKRYRSALEQIHAGLNERNWIYDLCELVLRGKEPPPSPPREETTVEALFREADELCDRFARKAWGRDVKRMREVLAAVHALVRP